MLHIVIEPNEIETNTQQDEKIEIEETKEIIIIVKKI